MASKRLPRLAKKAHNIPSLKLRQFRMYSEHQVQGDVQTVSKLQRVGQISWIFHLYSSFLFLAYRGKKKEASSPPNHIDLDRGMLSIVGKAAVFTKP